MAGPTHARTQTSGARKYVDPQDSSKAYPSVTTILNALAKPALPAWAAKTAAEFVRDEWESVASLMDSGKPDAMVALVKGAPWRSRDKAASLGSAVHDAAEAWMLDKPMPAWPDKVEPFMEQFVEWLSDWSPEFEATELTVANPAIGYAGTLDAIVRIPALQKTFLVDYKTGKGVYPEFALQLAAYRHATEVWLPDGSKVPMPPIDGCAVLHLQPGHYEFVPVYSNDSVFNSFLAALAAHDWKENLAPNVIADPLRPQPAVQAV